MPLFSFSIRAAFKGYLISAILLSFCCALPLKKTIKSQQKNENKSPQKMKIKQRPQWKRKA